MFDTPNKTELIMNTIKWINDTFVPLGLKPIEDLPKAQPGMGDACVIAKVLQTIPAFKNVNVSSSEIHLNISNGYSMLYDKPISWEIEDRFPVDEHGERDDFFILPDDVAQFIKAFDHDEYPELLDTHNPVANQCDCSSCLTN